MPFPSGKKNVLVTGGAGFIGSHLCAALLQADNHVICLDNYKTSSVENISPLLHFPDFEFIRHDITQTIDLPVMRELEKFQIKFQGVQEIYHLATPCTPNDYTNYPWEVMMAGSLGTINMLELADTWQAKLLFTSSPVIYGLADTQKLIPESYWGYTDLFGYMSAYAESKRFSETVCFWANKKRGLRAKIARVHNIYGPKMSINTGRPLAELIGQALDDQTIAIYDTEENIALLYIDDCVDCMLKLMASDELGPINVGGDTPYLMTDVAKLVISFAESKSTVEVAPAPAGRVPQLLLDVTKAKELLDWVPITKVEAGLKKTVMDIKATRTVPMGTDFATVKVEKEEHA